MMALTAYIFKTQQLIKYLRNMPKRSSPDSPMFEQFLNKIQANFKTKFVESESDTVSESNESDEHSYDGDTETESEYEVETVDKE